ncbi:MAG TPA: PAS domain S-box protein, partial [Planctomycetaceae bacterium]|nr:PAS domain S-box protein [Planctomycetaceae bacterium]
MFDDSRKKPGKAKLTQKVRLWFWGISLVPLVLFLFFLSSASERVLRQEVAARIDALVDLKAANFEEFIEEHRRDARVIAESSSLIAALEQLTKSDEDSGRPNFVTELREQIGDRIEAFGYTNALVVSPSGDELFAFTNLREPGTNYLTGPYRESELASVFDRARDANLAVLSNYVPLPGGGNPVLFVAAPIRQDAALLGVLILEIGHEQIDALVNHYVGLGETGETLLVKREAETITFLAPTRHDPQAAFRRTVRLGDEFAQSVQRASSGERGSGLLVDYRGQQVFSAWRPLSLAGWGMVVEIDAREVFAPLDRVHGWILVLGGLVASVLAALGWWVAGRLSQPIVKLTHAAHEIASGHFETQVTVDRNDEIGELAAAFNAMTNDMQRMHTTLEQQVRDRTIALNEEQARFRELAENIQEMFWLAEPDTIENAYVSPAYESIFGRSIEDLRSAPLSWVDSIHPDDRDRVRATFTKYSTSPESWESAFRILRPDGEVRWIRNRGFPILGEDGKPKRMAGIAEDVTDRMHDEEEFHQLFDQSQSLLLIAGFDGFVKKVNPAFQQVTGYSKEKLLNVPFIEFVVPDDREKTLRELEQGLKRGYSHQFDVRILREDGTVRQLRVNSTTSWDRQRFYVVGEDITERIEIESALAESERFASATLDALSAHLAILDEDGVILATNRAWREFAEANHSHTAGDVGANYLEVCDRSTGPYAEEAPAVAAGIRAVLRGENEEFWLEYPCHAPQEQRWFLIRVTKFGGAGPVRVVVSHENITETKLADEERQKFVAMVENSIDFIGLGSLTGGAIYVNPAGLKMVGLDPSRFDPTTHQIADFHPPEGRQMINEQIMTTVAIQGRWEGEIPFHNFETGQSIEAHASVFMVRHPITGKELGVAIVARDVTLKRQQEAELRKARAQLLDAIESLDAGLAMYDSDERLVVCNSRFKKFYGQAANAMIPGTPYEELLRTYYRSGIVPRTSMSEDEWVAMRLYSFRNPGEPTEQRLQDRWVRISDRRTSDGGVVSLRTDITVIKQLQEEAESANRVKSALLDDLASIHAKLEAITEAVPDILYMISPDGEMLWWSSNLEEIVGRSADEIALMDAFEYFPESEHAKIAAAIQESIER